MEPTKVLKEIVICPPKDLAALDWREYWNYRHMFWSLVTRNLKAEFDEMFFGIAWAFARPLLMVTVFVLFKNYSNAQTHVTIPYPIYVYSGLIMWFYFAETVSSVSSSIKSDSALISKIYYPRLISPAVPVVAGLAELAIASIPLLCMMVYYGIHPGIYFWLVPLTILQCMVLTMGFGCIFATLSLLHRDFERFLGLVLYIGMFASPTIYAPDMINEGMHVAYYLNPMAGIQMIARAGMFSEFPVLWMPWLSSWLITIALFFIGIHMYRSAESKFVEKM